MGGVGLYAALLYYPAGQYWSEDDEAGQMDWYGEFARGAMEAGVLRGGHALEAPAAGKAVTVRDRRGGTVLVTDAPFAEAKEAIGGVILLETASLKEALGWAARIPAAWRGRVEVRAVVATAPSALGAPG
jgi:hypothetical protein